MRADLTMSTLKRLCKRPDGVISLPGAFPLAGVLDLVGKVSQQAGILLTPKQNTVGRFSVASRASRFLVILLQGLGQRQMNHGTDSGLVDPEAKGDCADHHRYFIGHPAFLIPTTVIGPHLGVIGHSRDSLVFQLLDGLFDFVDGWAVDNDVAFRMMSQAG